MRDKTGTSKRNQHVHERRTEYIRNSSEFINNNAHSSILNTVLNKYLSIVLNVEFCSVVDADNVLHTNLCRRHFFRSRPHNRIWHPCSDCAPLDAVMHSHTALKRCDNNIGKTASFIELE